MSTTSKTQRDTPQSRLSNPQSFSSAKHRTRQQTSKTRNNHTKQQHTSYSHNSDDSDYSSSFQSQYSTSHSKYTNPSETDYPSSSQSINHNQSYKHRNLRSQKRGTKRKRKNQQRESSHSTSDNDTILQPKIRTPPLSPPPNICKHETNAQQMFYQNESDLENEEKKDSFMEYAQNSTDESGEEYTQKIVFGHNTHLSREQKQRFKHSRHTYAHKKGNHRIGISKRLRNHLSDRSFEYYTSMPKEWYNAKECVIGIETGRLLTANVQRLNGAYDIVNELLTDTIINNNIIEYETAENEDTYWEGLVEHLKADNATLQHIHNKMMSEMVSEQREQLSHTIPKHHKCELSEQFNDLIMNDKAYNIHKQRLFNKSWIDTNGLSNAQIETELEHIQRLKNGPNPKHRQCERKYFVNKYYKRQTRKGEEIKSESEKELQTDSDCDIESDKKRNDLCIDYDIKYDYFEDLNNEFDITNLSKGLPNGAKLMEFAKEFECKNKDFSMGERTLIGLPVNDSIYPLLMHDLVSRYQRHLLSAEKERNDLRIGVTVCEMNVGQSSNVVSNSVGSTSELSSEFEFEMGQKLKEMSTPKRNGSSSAAVSSDLSSKFEFELKPQKGNGKGEKCNFDVGNVCRQNKADRIMDVD